MSDLFSNLGIEWHLIAAQIVNFAVLLFVLQRFIYRPLIKLLRERREKIAEDEKQRAALEEKLRELEEMKEKIAAEARRNSERLIKEAEANASRLAGEKIAEAETVIKKLGDEAERRLIMEKEKMIEETKRELGTLLVSAIEKSLPAVLDKRGEDKLVEEAMKIIRETAPKNF